MLRIVREEGIPKLFAGYPPYAFRNIVFSIVKFSVFDPGLFQLYLTKSLRPKFHFFSERWT